MMLQIQTFVVSDPYAWAVLGKLLSLVNAVDLRTTSALFKQRSHSLLSRNIGISLKWVELALKSYHQRRQLLKCQIWKIDISLDILIKNLVKLACNLACLLAFDWFIIINYIATLPLIESFSSRPGASRYQNINEVQKVFNYWPKATTDNNTSVLPLSKPIHPSFTRHKPPMLLLSKHQIILWLNTEL